MAKRLAVILCACVVALCGFVLPALPQTVESIAAVSRQSICVVLAGGENGTTSGTGFVVADGFVLTAYHVVQNGGHLRVLCPDHSSIEVTVAKADAGNDVALLQSPLLTIRPLPLGVSANVQVGQEVVVIGFPRADLIGGGTATVTQGIVSGVQGGAVQIQAPMGPGNSGSPVLTLRGQVIGILRAVLGSQMGSNFATSFATAIDAAKPFLTAALGSPAPHPPTPNAGSTFANGPPAPPAPPPAPGSSNFVITPGRSVGDLKLEMNRGQLEALLGPAKNVWQKANAEISFRGGVSINWFDKIGPDASRGLFAVVSGSEVTMIGVLNDPKYVIPAPGLHAGSSEDDVRAALGEPSRVETVPDHKLLYYDSLGVRFAVVTNRSWGIYGLAHVIAVYRAN